MMASPVSLCQGHTYIFTLDINTTLSHCRLGGGIAAYFNVKSTKDDFTMRTYYSQGKKLQSITQAQQPGTQPWGSSPFFILSEANKCAGICDRLNGQSKTLEFLDQYTE